MQLLKLALFWLLLAAAIAAGQLRQGRLPKSRVLIVAVLGASLVLGIGVLSQDQAGLPRSILLWLNRFLLYLSLMPLFTKLPWRRTVTSGLVFSSSMTLLELLELIA